MQQNSSSRKKERIDAAGSCWKRPDPEPIEDHLGEAPIRPGDSVIVLKKEVDALIDNASAIRVEPRDERPLHLLFSRVRDVFLFLSRK